MTQVKLKHVRDDETLVFTTLSGREYRVTFKNGLAQTIVGHPKYCPRPTKVTSLGSLRPHGAWTHDFETLYLGFPVVFSTSGHPELISTTEVNSFKFV